MSTSHTQGYLNGLALCSGIGGIELGLADAIGPAYRTVCHVEREAFCVSVLAARMAEGRLHDAPIWSDLTTFDGKPWRGFVDIVTGGYPCQPFSVAGKRAGANDPRHIWPHVARIVREVRPTFAFFENVPGHVSMGLSDVCADLRKMGYDVQAGIFSAAEIGAPHIRKRLFILAHLADAHGQRCEPRRAGADLQQWGIGPDCRGVEVADANSLRELQPSGGECIERRRSGDGGGWWVVEPDVGRVAHGIPFRVDRLRALGNAVVPAAATLAFKTLAERIL